MPEIKREHYIYFVKDKVSGLIKIGATDADPWTRLSMGRGFNPNPMRMLGFYLAPYRRDPDYRFPAERDIHVRFAEHRRFREWFAASPELLSFIHERCGDPPVEPESLRRRGFARMPLRATKKKRAA